MYQKIGNCEFYCGNSLEILNKISHADTVVTDPPYGLGEPSGTISKKRAHKREYIGFEDTYDYLLKISVPIIKMSLEITKGRGIITPGAAHAFEYPKPEVMGAFYQPASMGMCSWGRQTIQPILFYGKDPHAGKTIAHTTYTLTEAASTKEHPCAKPQKAWNWVVSRASASGETVLDPFCGSGTTAVSCIRTGRKFIGIELEEKFFELSCRRAEKALSEPDMFLEEKPSKYKKFL